MNTSTHRRFSPVLAVLLSAIMLPACSGGDSAPPVATVSLDLSRERVPIGAPLDLTYRFDVAPDAEIDGDYRVFVHALDDRGQEMWTDDHDPPMPTSQWRPGQTVQYTRTIFVPSFPFVGNASIVMGLYRGTERLPLQGADPADRESTSREYRVASLELLPQSENIYVIRKDGWHPVEFLSDNPAVDWEWTQKVATLSFQNPRKDVTFYLEYDARPDLFEGAPQQVSVFINDHLVRTLTAEHANVALERIPVTADQLGTADMVEVRLEVDKTFVPANLPSGGRDTRELGIRVYNAFVDAR